MFKEIIENSIYQEPVDIFRTLVFFIFAIFIILVLFLAFLPHWIGYLPAVPAISFRKLFNKQDWGF